MKDVFRKINYILDRKQKIMIQWLNQSIGGIKETKVLQRETLFIGNYGRNQRKYAVSLEKSLLLSNAPNNVLLSACICTVLVMLGFLLLRGKMFPPWSQALPSSRLPRSGSFPAYRA